jgi:hypothetical protein
MTISSFYVDERGVMFVGTSSGLFWSNTQGRLWIKSLGDLFDFTPIRSLQRYDSEAFVATGTLGSYLCVSKVTSAISALDGAILTGGVPERVVVDGISIGKEALEVSGNDVRLRSQKGILDKIPNGLSTAQIYSKTKEVSTEILTQAYIYKEREHAAFFAPYGKSYGVVIAASGKWDSSKEFSDLTDAVAQAKKLEEYLHSHGFEVKSFYEEDATEENIRNYLSLLETRLKREDRVLFYFSGHGVSVPGAAGDVGYLLTYPATLSTIRNKGIPMSRLESQYADELVAKHVLFLIDACFSGLALKRGTPSVQVPDDVLTYEKLSQLTKGTSRSILVASEGNQSALDKKGGLFTQAVLEGLNGQADFSKDGIITAEELAVYVKTRVLRMANENFVNQDPKFETMDSFGNGEFVFLSK